MSAQDNSLAWRVREPASSDPLFIFTLFLPALPPSTKFYTSIARTNRKINKKGSERKFYMQKYGMTCPCQFA
jgi:hypothetical protein